MSGEMSCRPEPASTESAGPCNCANPATTEARARKADRMDVTLRFSYEDADKIYRPLLWGRLLICAGLAIAPLPPRRGAAAVANRRAGCQPAPHRRLYFPFFLLGNPMTSTLIFWLASSNADFR